MKTLLASIALLALAGCQTAPASAAKLTVAQDRQVLVGLWAMRPICKMQNDRSAPWVGQALHLIAARRGWSMEQMLDMADRDGRQFVADYFNAPQTGAVRAAKNRFCADMRNLKRATQKVFQ